ncbi:MAG: hypothetical protein K8R39_08030 [Arcobacteraceae bacterium]|nr:hypothetical protein [Arcobacteraceae bacterium]
MKDFYEQLIEHDLNPYLLFDSSGKVKSYNKEAEFLLNFVSIKELFQLAVSNASLNFGFNHKYISLKYNKQSYYAILVGYANDDEIALRLYKVVSNTTHTIKDDKLKLVNIFSLIDLSKNSTLLHSKLNINELYDISIPEIKININDFLLCLNECFSTFKEKQNISLQVYIKTGEYEIINQKKCKIVALEFISEENLSFDKSNEKNLETKALKSNANVFFDHNSIKLELPMIL